MILNYRLTEFKKLDKFLGINLAYRGAALGPAGSSNTGAVHRWCGRLVATLFAAKGASVVHRVRDGSGSVVRRGGRAGVVGGLVLSQALRG